MSKPSIAELLIQSGHTTFTAELITRAIKTLYGQIGAGLDERNWSAILATSNALASAESALSTMYQSADFLLRNANHLSGRGYNEHQIELNYRQTYTDLGLTYSPRWSLNTAFQPTSELTLAQLLAATSAANLPVPTITFAATDAGLSVTLSEAGSVIMSDSGYVGFYARGTSSLREANAVSSGFLTVTGGSSNKTSTATTDFVVLGTTGNDIIDTSGVANRVDYIYGGAGQDRLTSGSGADSLLGGAGADTLFGGAGSDTLIGGADNDVFAVNGLTQATNGTDSIMDFNFGTSTTAVDSIQLDFVSTTKQFGLASTGITAASGTEILVLDTTTYATVGAAQIAAQTRFGNNDNAAEAVVIWQDTLGNLNLSTYVDSSADATANGWHAHHRAAGHKSVMAYSGTSAYQRHADQTHHRH